MQDDAPEPVAGAQWVKPALVVSPALYVAVIAMIAGALLRDDGPRCGSGSNALAVFGSLFIQDLSQEDCRVILRRLRAVNGAALPDRDEHLKLFDRVLEALDARTFDACVRARAVGRQADNFGDRAGTGPGGLGRACQRDVRTRAAALCEEPARRVAAGAAQGSREPAGVLQATGVCKQQMDHAAGLQAAGRPRLN
jgi:hypothetical protein